ncbi:MAG: hypothetical protein LBJ35_03750 [Spirochaetaceae bacterium]|jgi:hypothetical protein|nr:hypothetical protein [Spirochaetaceae bacterium]
MTHLEKAYLDIVPVYSFLLFLLGGLAVFMLRPPVVVITDDVFSAVYGTRREHFKRIEMSAQLFRRVKLVRVSEKAELDAIIFAVRDAARRPVSAVFPYRYYEAARLYAAQNPKTPVVVMAGQNKTPANNSPAVEGDGALVFIKEDEAADFYHAGLCAALLSTQKDSEGAANNQADTNKTILMIVNGDASLRAGDIFERGLRDRGSGASCVFKEMNDNYPINDLSCVAIWGQASAFLYSSTENEIPVIVFSWIDPDFASPNVKIIVDDSPLQLLPAVIKSLGKGDVKRVLRAGNNVEIFVPSVFKIMTLRTDSLPLVLRLNIAARLPVNSAASGTGGRT